MSHITPSHIHCVLVMNSLDMIVLERMLTFLVADGNMDKLMRFIFKNPISQSDFRRVGGFGPLGSEAIPRLVT